MGRWKKDEFYTYVTNVYLVGKTSFLYLFSFYILLLPRNHSNVSVTRPGTPNSIGKE